MSFFDLRWRHFRSFEDTGWINIRPITVFIGENSSGKTSILAPLLMLKQTLESNNASCPLRTNGELFNAGSYENLIYRHDKGRELIFSIRRTGTRKTKQGEHPWEFSFTFANDARDPLIPILKSFEVKESGGDLLLCREMEENGQYYTIKGKDISLSKNPFSKEIKESGPEYFLFQSDPLNFLAKQQQEDKDIVLGQGEKAYINTTTLAAHEIKKFLKNISFIGPLREHPKRSYDVSADDLKHVGIYGEHAPEILFRRHGDKRIEIINEWIKKFNFGVELACEEIAAGVFTIFFRRPKTSLHINLADTGFGLSQVLPLIVQCFFGEDDNLIIIEQPEIHLNPKLQAILADLFYAVSKKKKNIIVETHSEHIILRLRRLIAEQKLSPKDVGIYYSEKVDDRSKIVEIPIENDGHINPDKWPERFFEDALHEAFALALAQEES